jgi:hypothetical protein
MMRDFYKIFKPDLYRIWLCLLGFIVSFPVGQTDPPISWVAIFGFPVRWMIVHKGFGRYYTGYSILWGELAISLLCWYILSSTIIYFYNKFKERLDSISENVARKWPFLLVVIRSLAWGLFAVLASGQVAPVLAVIYAHSDASYVWPPAWASIIVWLFANFLIPNLMACIALGVMKYLYKSGTREIKHIELWGGFTCGLIVSTSGLFISNLLGSRVVLAYPAKLPYTFVLLLVVWVMVIYGWVIRHLIKN